MQYRKILVKDNFSAKGSILDKLLALKNFSSKKEKDKFLNPKREDFISPYAFLDMEKAVKRTLEAIKKGEKILVWGDFDCDGVTSSTVCYKTLKYLGANFDVFIPDRLLHGHGLNSKELLKFVSKEKVKLIITVDCATSNNKEINLLKSLGVDTIITDHHSTDTELPCAYAIINPQVKNSIDDKLDVDLITSLTYNSGSIIAFKFAAALLESFKDKKDDYNDLIDELIVISSMGAIADVVPLLGENRSMVSCALKILNEKKEKSNKGVYKLFEKNIKDKEITSYDAAFILAPRINAVGRLSNAKLSFDFLTTDDDTKLDFIIEKLDNFNRIRQSKCSETFDEITEYLKNNPDELNNPAVILINPDWHIGVIGIVAAKIVEEYNKPCFLMTIDDENNARCSIRSNEFINVYNVLKENENLFSGFGGHSGAGGCSFNLDTISFDDVKKALIKTLEEQNKQTEDENVLYCDVELKSDEIGLNIIDDINILEPFGEKNAPPIFCLFEANLDEFKLIGKEQNHLKFIVSKDDKTFECVKWNEKELNIPLNSKIDIAFFPRVNTFNDTKTIQLEIVDVYSKNIIKKTGLKIFDHRKKTGILSQIASYLEREGLDIGVWAKTPRTKEILNKYPSILDKFIDEKPHKGIMFFDYPGSVDELKEILSTVKPQKIHLMNYKIDENIENYIKQLLGMIKYSSNKLNGKISFNKLSKALGVNEKFIQLSLEIFEEINSVDILDVDRIQYLKPYSIEKFKNSSKYPYLISEFESVINFKKSFLNDDIDKIEQYLS